MPKDIWKTKRRKKSRKNTKTSDAAIIERSRMPDPNDPTISIGMLSDLSLTIPLKTEVFYPDTRFQSSTTLFPSEGVEEKYVPSETSSQSLKRSAQDELFSTMLKKRKMDRKTKSVISDDCKIIENPKKRVKIEVVDLADDSRPVVSLLCSPVKISFLGNRLPGKLNTDIQANWDVGVKVESRENTCEINANAVGSAGMNSHTVQAITEQYNPSERNDEVNESDVAVNKNADLLGKDLSRIQVKTEKSVLSESVNSNESSVEHSSGNHIKIKTEKGISSKYDTEINLEISPLAVSKITDSTTHDIPLMSEVDKENVDNRDSAGNLSRIQGETGNIVPIESVNADESYSIKNSSENRIKIKTEKGISTEKSTAANLENFHISSNKSADSATHNISSRSEVDKENVNNRYINVTIKVEQKESSEVDDNSISILNFPSDQNRTSIYPVDRPIKREQNETDKNCEVSNNYTPIPKPVTQVKSEPEMMDSQDAYSCEKLKNNEETSQEIANSNNRYTVVESSETSIRNEFNPKSISRITNNNIFPGDKQMYKPGTFRTPLLKYLNCNKKVEAREISMALSVLKNLINNCRSLDYDEQNETSNSRKVVEKENINKILSKDFLRQILSNSKSSNSNGITDVGSSLNKPLIQPQCQA